MVCVHACVCCVQCGYVWKLIEWNEKLTASNVYLMLTDVVLWYFLFFCQFVDARARIMLSFCIACHKKRSPVVYALLFLFLSACQTMLKLCKIKRPYASHTIRKTRPTESVRIAAFSIQTRYNFDVDNDDRIDASHPFVSFLLNSNKKNYGNDVSPISPSVCQTIVFIYICLFLTTKNCHEWKFRPISHLTLLNVLSTVFRLLWGD